MPQRASDHIYTTKRVQCSFQRLVGLQANDFFQPLLDITGSVGGNSRGNIGIKIDWRVGRILDADPFHHLVPQSSGRLGGIRQKLFVAFIRGIVLLDEITNVDFMFPVFTGKTLPCLDITILIQLHINFHSINLIHDS